jgi:site-specific DNA recombinase
MKAVIYTRISTEYQEDGHSPEEQLRRCRAYAEMEGHEVMGHYHDTGSGSSFEHRPNYLEMMSKAGVEWRVVVIYKLDRIHRSLRNHVLWMDELRHLECDFISTEERVDTSTPQGRFFIQIMASYAEMERETISSRVKMGLEGARRSGRWIGVPPYGYKMDDTFTESGTRKNPGALIPVETEADVVKTILKLHVEGRKLSEIITQLVLERKYTRSGTLVWNRSTVKAVFNRCQLYLAGSTGFNEGSDEDFLFGRALQQPPIYGPDDLDFEVVAGALLEVSVDDNNTPDFEWNKLTHTEQLNNNSLVRRTIRCDEEE